MVETTTSTKEVFTTLQTGKESIYDILSFLSEIEADINQMLTGSLALRRSGQYKQLTATDVRLALFARARARGGVPFCIRNMLLEAISNVEKSSGFAALTAALYATVAVQSKLQLRLAGVHHSPDDISTEIQEVTRLSTRASRDKAFKTLRQYNRDPLTSSITIQACNMTGHNGQVYIDNEYSSSSSIELTAGYTFQCGMENNFQLSTKTGEWKEYSVKVLVIDGLIESVGEINRVLEYFHEEKRPGVIFARGFSEEVLGTLSVNKSRGTLNIIPVKVEYDLEGINTLVDLAVVCGTDVVSSLKGDVISAIDPLNIVTVDKVVITSNRSIISNKSSDYNVKNHIKNIINQKDSTNVEDKQLLFDKRTKSLSSVCTNIKLSSNLDNKAELQLRIQHGINMLKQICRYGIVDLGTLKNHVEDINVKNVITKFETAGYTSFSSRELALGLHVGNELANSILSSAAYVVLDNDLG